MDASNDASEGEGTAGSEEALYAAARAWIAGDPDPETRAELEALVQARDVHELRERLERPLTFGTAGLRGLVGAGPSRMNRAVVLRTTRALAEYLLAREPEARTLPVVVGFDGRHSSRAFAEATVSVLAAARIPVRYFAEPVPTPLVAYALRQLAGTAGIVITASHNPAQYNGYKLYAANGVQIVPPVDDDVQRRIESVGPALAIPVLPDAMSAGAGSSASPVPESITERYLSDIRNERPQGKAVDRSFPIVYTPLHGVGGTLALRALHDAGFSDVVAVPEQAEPDGDFPTVRFPNPEEAGALDLAVRLATERKAELVLANDPDADRLAVCVPTPAGRFIPLTGNQIGVLLADFMLEHAAPTPRPLVASSIVSSPMLGEIAAAYSARFEQTLTGFKWVWNAALHLEASEGVRFVFGYEEAIGYSVNRLVRDKDGISAALVFADLAARCRADGVSVLERLAGLYERFGLWVSIQKSIVRPGLQGVSEIERAVDRVAAEPPAALGGHAVRSCTDFRVGAEARPAWLGASPLVVLDLGAFGRVLLRPSGTEPKLKIYVDLRSDSPRGADLNAAEQALRSQASDVATELAARLGF